MTFTNRESEGERRDEHELDILPGPPLVPVGRPLPAEPDDREDDSPEEKVERGETAA